MVVDDVNQSVFGRSPGQILYTIHNCTNIMAALAVFTAAIYLKFILIPLTLAYFVCFLMTPIMDLCENRPFQKGFKKINPGGDNPPPEEEWEEEPVFMCSNGMTSEARLKIHPDKRGDKSVAGIIHDLTSMGRLPHGFAVIATMVLVVLVLYLLLGVIIGSAFADFSESEAVKVAIGTKQMAKLEGWQYQQCFVTKSLPKEAGVQALNTIDKSPVDPDSGRATLCVVDVRDLSTYEKAENLLGVDGKTAIRASNVKKPLTMLFHGCPLPGLEPSQYPAGKNADGTVNMKVKCVQASSAQATVESQPGEKVHWAGMCFAGTAWTEDLLTDSETVKGGMFSDDETTTDKLTYVAADADKKTPAYGVPIKCPYSPMSAALLVMGNELIDSLEESVKIFRPYVCAKRNASTIRMVYDMTSEASQMLNATMKEEKGHKSQTDDGKDTDLLMAVHVYALFDYKPTKQHVNQTTHPGENSCTRRQIFEENKDGDSMESLMATLSALNVMVADMTTILLLTLYVLLERPEGQTVPGDAPTIVESEDLMKTYIKLKTGVSALTGFFCAVFMVVSATPLGAVFGLLSFLLNYIPTVGSIIAMVLPIPVILLSDQSPGQKTVGLFGPIAVQGYVGNALEPAMFGEALNLTAMSILIILVLMSAVWGLPGAVLCVPMLGMTKIMAHHTDHPQAKAYLKIIREVESVDLEKDKYFANIRKYKDQRRDQMEAIFAKNDVKFAEAEPAAESAE